MLKRKALLALATLATACALAAWLAYATRTVDSGREARPSLLSDVEPQQIQRIELRRARGRSIVMARSSGADRVQWRLERPLAIDANMTRIHHLLGFARISSHEQIELVSRRETERAVHSQLAPFGLDAPWVVLRLGEHQIDFGDKLPTADARYVRVGETVHVISDSATHQLRFGPTGFVGLNLLPTGTDIRSITLAAGGVMRDGQSWQLVGRDGSAIASDVQTDLLIGWMEGWRLAQAVAVRALPTEIDPNEPDVVVELATSPTPLHFRVINDTRTTRFVRATLGIAYEIPSERAQVLLTLPTNDGVSQ